MAERAGWFGPALALVILITAARLALLWFDRTDLFVDESQYWLWGQFPDLGYYSKPPLIAWVIGAVTALAGSDAPFWVRMPGPIFHGATALILGAVSARLFSLRAALWTAAAYVTLPFAALGGLMISTDTIMAPFFAAALLFYLRTIDTGRLGSAALCGIAVGLACLAKYAGLYFLIGIALAAAFVPEARIRRGAALVLVLAFAAMLLPNLLWNAGNGFSTFEHTADNVGWVREGSWLAGLDPAGMAGFFLSQFGVFGPVLFAALLVGYLRPDGAAMRALGLVSLPALVAVTIQALLSRAYANWALAAYFPGLPLAIAVLAARAPRLLWVSLAINGLITLALPVLTVIAPAPLRDGVPLLARYLGRAEMSHQIIAAARAADVSVVVADNRDLTADLFYTGRDSGLAFFAPPPKGRPQSYYEEEFPLPPGDVPVLFVSQAAPDCGAGPAEPVQRFESAGGAYRRDHYAAWRITADCLHAR